MTTQNYHRSTPEYIVQQLQQIERDRQHALGAAVARLEDAQTTFKETVMEIAGRC